MHVLIFAEKSPSAGRKYPHTINDAYGLGGIAVMVTIRVYHCIDSRPISICFTSAPPRRSQGLPEAIYCRISARQEEKSKGDSLLAGYFRQPGETNREFPSSLRFHVTVRSSLFTSR
ncbi:hypothetical protein CIHG_01391 [Coccidioides immitis H538.4]|uniref:Uncharacterized protein n=2 Tax=Coccidioides immitis TaxID=5501 RepID=A0A0J8QST3_COCIT|nr:hypothetical protein CISG_04667 [Coccidioides immitis RMSCC 3703]KMU83608.1 hypothetical protein CIHG_01391 [Coccidioides immitis H538.4]